MEYVVESSYPKSFNNDFINKISEGRTIIIPNMATFEDQPIHFMQNGGVNITACDLNGLTLNMSWRVNKDKVLLPVFISKSAPTDKYLMMAPKWYRAANMRLLFVRNEADGKCHLIAYDSSKRAYKLPLPNLHDDVAVCMGSFVPDDSSWIDRMVSSLKQFKNSSWNTDLAPNQKNAEELFRFQFADDKSVQHLEVPANWDKYCAKVSTPLTDLIIKTL